MAKSALCQQRIVSANVTTSAHVSNDAWIQCARCADSEYCIVPWCSSIIHVHLSKLRLACPVSNVTLNNVFKLKLVWCVAVSTLSSWVCFAFGKGTTFVLSHYVMLIQPPQCSNQIYALARHVMAS